MHSGYIEQRNGGYYVAGTRISLDSVVYAFNRGDSPERILEEFPLLDRVSRVYEEANPVLWKKIQRARSKMGDSRA